MQTTDFRKVTLAILAGGAGSRMGGPKLFLKLNDKPILEYLLERFEWPGPKMLVLTPGIEKPAGADGFDQIVQDPIAGAGPLRGVLTALENATTNQVIVATIDMPGITRDHLQWIARQLHDPELSGAMCVRPPGQIEPFPSAYRSSVRALITESLAEQRRSVHGLLKKRAFKAIPCPTDWPAEVWTNLNTRKDLEQFENKRTP